MILILKKKKIKECHPYKNGYIKLDNIALENINDFYLLPNDKFKLKKIHAGSIFLYVFGFKNKRPILGMQRLNPYKFFNGHGITADFMQERLGVFDYAISGLMLKKQNSYLINDNSGHFDQSVNTYLYDKYKNFDIVKYFNLFFKKHFNKLIGKSQFVSFIDKTSEKIEENTLDFNEFMSRVCTPESEIPVFDSKENCEKNNKSGYKGNICDKLDNLIFEDSIQKEVKKKLKSNFGLTKLKLIKKLLLDTITDKELRIMMNEFNIKMPITKISKNIIKNRLIKKLNLTKNQVPLINELIEKESKQRARSITDPTKISRSLNRRSRSKSKRPTSSRQNSTLIKKTKITRKSY